MCRRDRDVQPSAAIRNMVGASEVPQDLSRPHRPIPEDIIGAGDAISRGLIPRSIKEFDDRYPRRNLRPRTERNYAESPDIIVLSDEEPRINGFATNGYDSDTDEGEMPPLPPIKVSEAMFRCEMNLHLLEVNLELKKEERKLTYWSSYFIMCGLKWLWKNINC